MLLLSSSYILLWTLHVKTIFGISIVDINKICGIHYFNTGVKFYLSPSGKNIRIFENKVLTGILRPKKEVKEDGVKFIVRGIIISTVHKIL